MDRRFWLQVFEFVTGCYRLHGCHIEKASCDTLPGSSRTFQNSNDSRVLSAELPGTISSAHLMTHSTVTALWGSLLTAEEDFEFSRWVDEVVFEVTLVYFCIQNMFWNMFCTYSRANHKGWHGDTDLTYIVHVCNSSLTLNNSYALCEMRYIL